MTQSHQIEERAATYGMDILSDRELLTLLTRSDAITSNLLEAAGSLANLRRWSAEQFREVKGIGKSTACRLASVFTLSARSQHDSSYVPNFDGVDAVFNYMKATCSILGTEKFWVLCLDRKNNLIRKVEATSGTATNCLVHPREVYRTAIQVNATAIICVHNHPSGDPAPSRADIHITRQLREAAKIIGIDLIDHIIMGERSRDPQHKGFYSFNDAGLI